MILSVVAAASVLELDLSVAFLDEPEPIEVEAADRSRERSRSELRRATSHVVRIVNAGSVDEDPARHAAMIASIERAAREPADIVTDDDDLTPAGTYADWYPPKLKTFRTVCVRLCDGALTPVSFATSKDRLALDALRCRQSCDSPAKLYVQRNPATETETLVDLDGKPYAQLATAFKFRTSYDNACTCRPHAWQGSARARHRMHEIQARMNGGRKVLKGRLAAIRAAAARSSGMAVAGPPTRAGQGVVTGSAGTSSGATAVAAAEIELRSAALSDPPAGTIVTDVNPMPPKGKRKLSGKRKSRSIDSASAKAMRAKASNNAALVVLFGGAPAVGDETATKPDPGVLPSNSLVSASAASRRYDGKDWRISNYEPM